MNILGINAYHGDSSACLVQNGILRSAAEEERFLRIKHWAGLPIESIRYCLESESLSLADIDHVAINTNPKANLLKKVCFTIKSRPDFKMVFDKIKTKKQREARSAACGRRGSERRGQRGEGARMFVHPQG